MTNIIRRIRIALRPCPREQAGHNCRVYRTGYCDECGRGTQTKLASKA